MVIEERLLGGKRVEAVVGLWLKDARRSENRDAMVTNGGAEASDEVTSLWNWRSRTGAARREKTLTLEITAPEEWASFGVRS